MSILSNRDPQGESQFLNHTTQHGMCEGHDFQARTMTFWLGLQAMMNVEY
jgi:hypothetical protein